MLKVVRTMLIVILNTIIYGVVLFAGVQLCSIGYSFAYEVLGDTTAEFPPGEEKEFTIEKNEDAFTVAGRLEEDNLVKNRYSFYLRMLLEESEETKLTPGDYTLNTCMSYEEIVSHILK